jgi:hypothetical protein
VRCGWRAKSAPSVFSGIFEIEQILLGVHVAFDGFRLSRSAPRLRMTLRQICFNSTNATRWPCCSNWPRAREIPCHSDCQGPTRT